MSFLSHLLNPKTALRGLVDPLAPFKNGNSGAATPAAVSSTDPTAIPDTSADYYGDQGDPSYGSFAKPFGVEDFYNYADPGYAFQLQQGTQGLQNSAAAGSGAMSGAALKDLLKYNQDYAGTAYNDAFNRYQTQQGNIFSRLSSVLNLGQNAAAGVGQQGTTLAGNAGQALQQSGAAAGAGIVGAGNSLNGGLSNYWLMKQFGGA